jgi:hypothetical protein
MNKKMRKAIAVIIIVIGIIGISFLVNCILVKILSMCFGFTFTWKLATGIWIIILILKNIFNVTVKK